MIKKKDSLPKKPNNNFLNIYKASKQLYLFWEDACYMFRQSLVTFNYIPIETAKSKVQILMKVCYW